MLVARLESMNARPCSKIACTNDAVATLTYDYGDAMAVLGPLGLTAEPHAHDLCVKHSERLSVPQGWQVVRHVSLSH
jgi:hypothetical protein